MRVKSLGIIPCLVALSFSTFLPVCLADTINIDSGEIVKGTVIRFSPYATEIYSRGQRRTIQTKQIVSISTNSPVSLLLDNGEKIIGILQIKDSEGIILSQRLGNIPIHKKEISSFETTLSEIQIAELDKPKVQHASSKKDMTIGEENKKPPMDYLRGSTVLRKPGELELALTMAYERGRYDNPVISTMFGVLANETRYKFMTDLSLTLGITERLEAWVDFPYEWAKLERVEGIYKEGVEHNGIGDVSFGVRFLAVGEGDHHPSVTLSLDAIAPTGDNPYTPDVFDASVAPGNGHWSIRPGLNFVNTFDPVIFFYGVNYKYNFPAEYYGIERDLGDSIGYYAGFGFAVNDRVSLSTRVMGEHQFESRKDGKAIYGTSQDPLSLGFSVYYRMDNGITLAPFVNIGANDDAQDFVLGVTCSKTF